MSTIPQFSNVHEYSWENGQAIDIMKQPAVGDSVVTLRVTTKTPQKDYEESKRRKVVSESCSAARNLDLEHSTGSPSRGQGQEPLQSEVTKRFDSVLRSQLIHWTGKLLKLQPKVHMSPHIMECGLCLFKRLRQKQLLSWADGKLPKAYISNRELMIHDLIACWWLAMKHCSIRTAVPNRTLLSRATDAKDLLLADCEMAALIALDWNVNSLLADEGLVKY